MAIKKGTAIVTGGAIRIGRAIAIALAEKGYDIALHYNSSSKDAEDTAKFIESVGRQCKLYKADFNNIPETTMFIDNVFDDFNNVNLLINNASIFEKYKFLETTEEIFDRNMNINFKAPFFITQHFAKQCKKGQIVNMLDTYVTKNSLNFVAYLLAKKSLSEFTEMSARILAPNIRVNAIAPGITGITRNVDQSFIDTKIKQLPLQDIASLDDIIHALTNLIELDFVTGQCLFVDGGEQLL